MKKILNSIGLKKFLNKKFPNLVLEIRTKQFIESFIFKYLKNLLRKCCLLINHRNGNLLSVRDLKLTVEKKLEIVENPLYNFKRINNGAWKL